MKNINLEKKITEINNDLKEVTTKLNSCKNMILERKRELKKIKSKYDSLNSDLSLKTSEYTKEVNKIKISAKKIRQEIRSINEKTKKLQNLLMLLEAKKRAIESFEYFNSKEIFKVIEYLVTNIEGKKYTLNSMPVLISVKNNFKYNLFYLGLEGMERATYYELKNRFPRMIDKSAIANANVSDNYLELAIYKDSDKDVIIFDELESDNIPYKFMNDISIIPHTKIYDKRFSYIYVFLNMVIDKRIETNSLLSLDAIYSLADSFISKQKIIKKY